MRSFRRTPTTTVLDLKIAQTRPGPGEAGGCGRTAHPEAPQGLVLSELPRAPADGGKGADRGDPGGLHPGRLDPVGRRPGQGDGRDRRLEEPGQPPARRVEARARWRRCAVVAPPWRR